MDERIMVKLTANEQFIEFQTILRNGSKSRNFYVSRDELLLLRTQNRLYARDGSFAAFRTDRAADALHIDFYWLNYTTGDNFMGKLQTVTISLAEILEFARLSALAEGPQTWRTLSRKESAVPQLTFISSSSLKAVAGNKQVRKKLSKFLRDNFNWKNCSRILFYGDFAPYSFFFCEYRGEVPGICGGLILHGQENMEKAYYSVHT